jgi:protein-tyrosine phosphatase
MIDIHSHILPTVDDGAIDLDTALEMARQAVADGITSVVATPHHGNGRFENEANDIRRWTDELNEQLKAQGIGLNVLPGQEIHTYRNWLDDLTSQKLTGINGSRYMLVECSTSLTLDQKFEVQMEEIIHELSIAGFVPIIAHPERYSLFSKDITKLKFCVERGALAQLTSHSVTGQFGDKIQTASMRMLKNGLVHFIASDAHDTNYRMMELSGAYAWIERKFNRDYVKLLKQNAIHAIHDEVIEPKLEKSEKRKWYFF